MQHEKVFSYTTLVGISFFADESRTHELYHYKYKVGKWLTLAQDPLENSYSHVIVDDNLAYLITREGYMTTLDYRTATYIWNYL